MDLMKGDLGGGMMDLMKGDTGGGMMGLMKGDPRGTMINLSSCRRILEGYDGPHEGGSWKE